MTGQTATPRHPSVLHALSAAWSLRQARDILTAAVEAEARAVAAEARALAASDGIRSSQWSTGRSRGGHGDPTGTAALTRFASPAPARPLAHLAASVTSTMHWLADSVHAPTGPDPLWRLLDVLPRLQPGTAEQLRQWLTADDTRIREALRLDPAERTLPGAECPACRRRPMTARTAAHPDDWTVVCAAGCRCAGQGCGCGMLVQVEGVVHVWDRATPAVVTWLARLTEGLAA